MRTRVFDLDVTVAEVLAAGEAIRVEYGGAVPAAGKFAADIARHCARPEVAALKTGAQCAAHLALWAAALGRDRASRSITEKEIDAVIRRWRVTPTTITPGQKGRPSGPKGLAPGTLKKRRFWLDHFFTALGGPNPVKAAETIERPKVEARGLLMPTIRRILAAMPDRSVRPGAPAPPAIARLVASLVAFTGLPPGIIQQITREDLVLVDGVASVRTPARAKGEGVERRTLALTADGLAAWTAFDAANLYGHPFAEESVNRAVKRAARRVGVTRHVTCYDLRHSFGEEMFRVTGSLEAVAWLMLHAKGSPITARYTMGADNDVARHAVAAFDAAQSTRSETTPAEAPRRLFIAARGPKVVSESCQPPASLARATG